jgi:hypothetical protein
MLLLCIVAALYSSTAKANHREPLVVKRTHVLPRVPHLSALTCIHGYEGAWNDDGGPYYFTTLICY